MNLDQTNRVYVLAIDHYLFARESNSKILQRFWSKWNTNRFRCLGKSSWIDKNIVVIRIGYCLFDAIVVNDLYFICLMKGELSNDIFVWCDDDHFCFTSHDEIRLNTLIMSLLFYSVGKTTDVRFYFAKRKEKKTKKILVRNTRYVSATILIHRWLIIATTYDITTKAFSW